MGPYAYKGNQWVGFDDVDTIRQKSEYVKANGFGGGMIWALDLDDFNNQCGCEKYPLLKTINRVLRGYSSPDPHCTLESNGVYQTRQHDLSVLTGNQFAIPASSYPLQQFVPYLPSQESQNVNNLRHYKKTPTAEDVDDDNVRFDPYGSNSVGSPLVLAALPGGFFKSLPNYKLN